MSHVTIHKLPDEMIVEIFKHVSIRDILDIVQNVCSQWRVLAHHSYVWKNKQYVVREDTSDEEAITIFSSAPQLRAVRMVRPVEPRILEALYRNCHRLTALETSYKQMLSYEEMKELFRGCSQIRILRISANALTADEMFLDALALLPHMHSLNLKRHGYYEAPLLRLDTLGNKCPQLRQLEISSFPYRLCDVQPFLAALKQPLARLEIDWFSVERRPVVPLLTACADSLEVLQLCEFDSTGEDTAGAFAALGQLRNLKDLTVESAEDIEESESNQQEQLPRAIPLAFQGGGLSKLQMLRLWGITNLGDEALRAVSVGCPDLRELSLHDCMGHTDIAFKPLHLMKKLEMFILCHCLCLGGGAFHYIAQLPAVRTLHFNAINFQKLWPGVECLLAMTDLRRLELLLCNCRCMPFGKFPGRLVNLR